MNLKRSIGTPGLLFAAIAGIMGSGWLFGPYFAVQIAGPAAVLSWVIGGFLMMMIALTYSELASAFPMAGGSVRYAQISHGTIVSFTMAWVSWLSATAVAPIETLAVIQYTSTYYPGLMHVVANTHVLTGSGFALAIVLMLVMCTINYFGASFMSKANGVIVFFKIFIPVTVMIYLMAYSFHPHNFVSQGFAPMGIKGVLRALPVAGVIFSLIGYNPAIQLAGEAKNPQRSIPFAILGALLIAVVFYVILQIVFIDAQSPQSFQLGWQNLTFHGDVGPFIGLAKSFNAFWLLVIIMVGATVAPFGTALIYTASAARMGYAMGDNGYLPNFLKPLNFFGVPARIIALNFVIGLSLFLPFPTWQKMVGFLVSAMVLAFAVGPLALIVLRKSLPNHPRPFRLPYPNVMCLMAFYVCNLIVFWTGWQIVSKIMIFVVIGYLFFALYKLVSHRVKMDLHWQNAWWLPIYLLATTAISYLGSFGGGLDVIPFGWDFLVIAAMTAIIYFSAKQAGIKIQSLS